MPVDKEFILEVIEDENFAFALENIKELPEGRLKRQLISRLLTAAISANDFDVAEDVAYGMGDEKARPKQLAAYSLGLLSAGVPVKSFEVAEEISDPECRYKVLTEIIFQCILGDWGNTAKKAIGLIPRERKIGLEKKLEGRIKHKFRRNESAPERSANLRDLNQLFD